MLEHDIDAFLLGDLARLALEAILAVVDDVIRAERLHALDLLIAADSGEDGATDGIGHHDRNSAEAGDARDGLAVIVAAFPARLAGAAGQRAVHHDLLARLVARGVLAGRNDFAGGFRADDERHLALGEGHAAIAPDVDMVERVRADADLHLIVRRRRRRRHFDDRQQAVGNEGKRAHGKAAWKQISVGKTRGIAAWRGRVNRSERLYTPKA